MLLKGSGKNGLLCILLRFTAPLRMALNWLWSVGFEEKCTASESLWTCTKLSWGRPVVPNEWNRAVNLKSAQFLHCDIGTCCLLNPLVHQFCYGLVPGWPQRLYMLAWPGFFPQQMTRLNWKSISFCFSPPPSLCAQTLGLSSMVFVTIGSFELLNSFLFSFVSKPCCMTLHWSLHSCTHPWLLYCDYFHIHNIWNIEVFTCANFAPLLVNNCLFVVRSGVSCGYHSL